MAESKESISLSSPSRPLRFGLIALGFLTAIGAAALLTIVHERLLAPATSQSSSGMLAFGDALLFAGTAAVLSLVPTFFLLRELRRVRWFWLLVAGSLLLLSASGPLFSIALWAWRSRPASDPLGLLASMAILRLFASPVLLCATFLVERLAADSVRTILRLALLMEGVTCVALLLWFALVR